MIRTERVRKMKPKFIEVQSDEFEEIETYQTDDGKVFTELKDAKIHESELKFSKIEKFNYWFPMIGDIWYKAKTQDDLDFLIEHLSKNYGGRRYGVGRLRIGEWFTVVSMDRDGLGIADHFVPLSKLTQDYFALLKELGQIYPYNENEKHCEKCGASLTR